MENESCWDRSPVIAFIPVLRSRSVFVALVATVRRKELDLIPAIASLIMALSPYSTLITIAVNVFHHLVAHPT
jgi:hypothetical protein